MPMNIKTQILQHLRSHQVLHLTLYESGDFMRAVAELCHEGLALDEEDGSITLSPRGMFAADWEKRG